ncbi:MAG: U32 family peptidase C-terminal domain-containing protein, partial [Clostridia bacterium]|nr:U32 family peptidase C-terminal domain-containing protein [Clostridia bacterium]
QEDDRGTYILNSKDLNMIEHLKEIDEAGIVSLKIEGRMKSPYYVATVVNAYRRAIDNYYANKEKPCDKALVEELEKTSHRRYTTGFYFGAKDKEYIEDSMPIQSSEFMAMVLEDTNSDGYALIEQRNRFKVADTLEVLSPTQAFGKEISISVMKDEKGDTIEDASLVQQKIYLYTGDIKLTKGDILRKSI